MANEEREELLEGLKDHYGSLTEVAKRAGVSLQYLGAILRGRKTVRSTEILNIASEVLEEKRRAEFEAEQQIKARLTGMKSLSVAQ